MAKKILIVDDEPKIIRLLATRLKAQNYDVIAAYDSVQAVKMAHECKPDLIILDIRMPAGGGMTAFNNLKMSVDTMIIPIIFLTADQSEETRKKALEMGAEDFLTKPFDGELLVEKVKAILKE